MEKQLEQLNKLFEYLGFGTEDATALSTGFLMPGDGAEPTLPIDNILKQAQSYAIPHVRTTLKKEFAPEFKGQYTNEFINKLIAESDGTLKRGDFDHKGDGDDNFGRAIKALLEVKTPKAGKQTDDSELSTKYKEALLAIENWEKKYTEDTTNIKSEYEQKETTRQFQDYLMSQLGELKGADGKSKAELRVDAQHVAKTAYRDISDVAIPKFVDGKWELYDKNNPDTPYTDGTKKVGVVDKLQNTIKVNDWIKQSNGGSGSAAQFLGKQQGQQSQSRNNPQQGNVSPLRQQIEAAKGEAA